MTGLAMEIWMCVGLIEDSTSIIECFPPVANEKMVSFLINAGHLIQSGLRLWTNGSLLMMITIIIKVTDQVTWSGVLGTGHTVLDKEHLLQVHIVAI